VHQLTSTGIVAFLAEETETLILSYENPTNDERRGSKSEGFDFCGIGRLSISELTDGQVLAQTDHYAGRAADGAVGGRIVSAADGAARDDVKRTIIAVCA